MKKYKMNIPDIFSILFKNNSVTEIVVENCKITRDVFLMEKNSLKEEYYKDIPASWIIIENNDEGVISEILDFFKEINIEKSLILKYLNKIILLTRRGNLVQKINEDATEYLTIEELEDFLKRKSRESLSYVVVNTEKVYGLRSKAYKYYIHPKDESLTGGSGAGRLTSWLKSSPVIKDYEYFETLNSSHYLNESFFEYVKTIKFN